MRLICPKCGLRLSVADKSVPAAGGWARCPQCGERFFLKPPGADPAAAPAAAPAPALGGQARQELLKRLRAKGAGGAPHEPHEYAPHKYAEEPTIFPRPDHSAAYPMLGGLILALVAAATLWLFRASVPRAPAAPPAVAAAARPGYDFALIRRDLLSVKGRLAGRQSFSAIVERSGSETRVFKYFRDRLTPEGRCPALSRLEIKSTAEGFQAAALCLDEAGRDAGRPLEMQLRWTLGGAAAAFPEYAREEEVSLSAL